MVFSSFTFLFVFLPLFLACYYLSGRRGQNFVALGFSYVFYTWGAPNVVLILVLSSVLDYLLSQRMAQGASRGRYFTVGVALNVALLAYYKYTNFFFTELNQFLEFAGVGAVEIAEIALPIGVSFFTFQKISYLSDVYRRVCEPARSVWDYLLYVALFPQLIAGPIVRYRDIEAQIKFRTHSFEQVFSGVLRFSIGLAKKVLIADEMGRVADNVFELAPSELYTSYAWIGVIAYAFQIYFDFSGYSDMAIGLGRMMGFEFLENFNFPYISQNITEFWRRWHISLSRWMREYLYIPLGGNRVSPLRMYFNLWVVFLLSGLWHGASWSFVIWGAYHGLFLAIDKLFWLDFSKRLPALVNTMLCFVVVLIGWVFFRVEDASEACSFIGVMFGFDQLVQPTSVYPAQIIHNRGIVIFTIAAIGCMLPVFQNLKKRSLDVWSRLPIAVRTQCAFLFAVCCVLLSVTALSASRFSPFLYFRF